MPRIFIALLLCSALLLAAAGERAQQRAQSQQPPPSQEPAPPSGQQPLKTGQTIVREINLVVVLFTVLNRRSKLVIDLDKPIFRVLDDGGPQEIRYFSWQTDLTLRIAMLMDCFSCRRHRL